MLDATEVFSALSDPARVRILAVLGRSTRCVCDLRAEVPIAPNVLSYHLKVLREAGLVTATRRGRWVDYAVGDDVDRLVGAALAAAGLEDRRPVGGRS